MKKLLYFTLILIFIISSIRLIAQNEMENQINKQIYTSDSLLVDSCYTKSSTVSYRNPDSSIWYAEKGLAITQKYDDRYFNGKEIQLLIGTGIAYSIKSNYVRSIKYYLKAIKLIDTIIKRHPEEQNHFDQALAVCYTNIGILYYFDKKYDLSIQNLLKSVPLLENSGSNKQKGQVFNNIGINYLAKKEYPKALENYKKALEYFVKDSSQRSIAMAYSNIGEVYNFMNQRKKALKYLEKAVSIKNELGDKYGMEVALYSTANTYFADGDYKKAISFANRSLKIAKEINNHYDVINDLDLLSKSYAADHQYDKAYFSLLQLKKINDSIFSENSETQLQELQTKYETQQKENEILLFKEKEKQVQLEHKMIRIGIGLLLVIFILVLVFLFNKRKHEKQLLEKELEKKKLKEEELNKEVTFKTKQLTTHALNMMQKNNMLNDLKHNLKKISDGAKPEVKSALARINQLIETNLKSDNDWEIFRMYFEQIDSGFYLRLTGMFPKLNNNDLRHCALLKLNMNLKETASVLNLSPNTVKSARNRLKKKLNLKPTDDLSIYIREL